jgi:biopolymer transport protein ExbD
MIAHFHERPRYKVKAPLTSLIDIVFLLLVYFLLTTNFIVDEAISIRLPKADASTPQVQRELVIFVDELGQAWIGTEHVPDGKLFDSVSGNLASRDNKTVVIRADKRLILDRAVRVMDVAKAAGARKLCLATEKNSLER